MARTRYLGRLCFLLPYPSSHAGTTTAGVLAAAGAVALARILQSWQAMRITTGWLLAPSVSSIQTSTSAWCCQAVPHSRSSG
jgi:hypothetical protein